MKIKKFLYAALMILPLVVTLIALQFLPDQIPAHYGFDNQVTRWGSKYETLVFPALSIVTGLIMLVIAKASRKQEKDGENNYQICIMAGLLSLGLFNVMTYYFLYTDFAQVENLNDMTVDMNGLIFGILGIFLMVLGNIMPKAKMNSLLGLRTTWSMRSERVWKKCQRFGGIVSMLCGAAMLLVSFLTRGTLCILLSLGIVLAMTVLDVVYSYRAAKAE